MSVRARANAILAGLIACAAILYRFPPGQYKFYPQCPVYRYLHIYCPGCGATRAMAALLHGRLAEAAHDNVLLLVLLPFLLAYFLFVYWSAMRLNRVVWPPVPKRAVLCLLVVAAIFTVVRNVAPASL
jgi:uncharacterized protein DUF2752